MFARFVFLTLTTWFAFAANSANAADREPPAIKLVEVASGFKQPTHIIGHPTLFGALMVVEQNGIVRLIQGSRGPGEVFLDISERVKAGGEKGLLSIAFHPRFSNIRKLYLNYTAFNQQLKTVIAEVIASADMRSANGNTERVLLTIDQPYSNHNGGQLAFGPDGMLYIGMGDGGSRWDPEKNGQNRRSLLGKMLRIDVDATSKDSPYGIPVDNPFIGDGAARPEVWAYGLRNPWRFSFDRANGELWAADVGQDTLEEIDLILRGKNYGWSDWEGTSCALFLGCRGNPAEQPLYVYGRSEGVSVTGGFVYRGKLFPQLIGLYLYGDFGSGRIWGLKRDANGRFSNRLLLESGKSISSFGEDREGELYLADFSAGTVFRIEALPQAIPLPPASPEAAS